MQNIVAVEYRNRPRIAFTGRRSQAIARISIDEENMIPDIPLGLAQTCNRMAIAELEIEAATKRTEDMKEKERIWNSFKILCPNSLFNGADDEVYKAHCRELIARAANAADTRPGTKAEALMVLSHTSLVAPPTRDASALYTQLFIEIFGEEVYRTKINSSDSWKSDLSGSHKDATNELLNTIRRKTMDYSRVIRL